MSGQNHGPTGSQPGVPLLVAALRRRAVTRPPVWLMRQAGRYLPEYRALRQRAGDFLELCYSPELAAEATVQPVRRYGFDAAILFSDILVIPDALGCPVAFEQGAGPKLEPVRAAAAVDRLRPDGLAERLAPVYEAIRQVRRSLPAVTALIGFAGAPWTLAAYMIEGGASSEFYTARAFVLRQPDTFAKLIALLSEAVIEHLEAQIEAGADVVQLFDSWAGILSEPEFERWCQAPAAQIVTRLKARHPEVPIIAFPRGAGVRYQSFVRAVPVDGVSLDTTVSLMWARHALADVCLQGNLDPAALLAGGAVACREARRIVEVLSDRPFVFNLGHGVLPQTDPAAVAALVDYVKSVRLPGRPEP
ncbi:MAG: uroporphyrinogen decarboxylase [Geminicoccaceae bacterium]